MLDDEQSVLEKFIGYDKNNEIIMLWYEVTYLRLIMGKFMMVDSKSQEEIDEIIESCRQKAKEVVVKRFPCFNISFPSEKKLPDVEGEA